MDNRYFWIKDRLEKEGIDMKYCPTEKMIADFFTKPLQGELFRKFRAVVMGHVHLNEVVLHSDTCKERVEEREKELKKRREESKPSSWRSRPPALAKAHPSAERCQSFGQRLLPPTTKAGVSCILRVILRGHSDNHL